MTLLLRWAAAAAALCLFCLVIGCGSGKSGSTSPTQNSVPTLGALSTSTAVAGGPAFTITASGNGFISASVLDWNGNPLPTTFVSPTSLTAQIPAIDLVTAAIALITIQNPAPGGGTSTSLTFTITAAPNPAPALTALSPSTAVAGSPALTITLAGSSFLASSQILWNGTPLPTTFVSSISLKAQVPANDLMASGTAAITVQNLAPGGGTSPPLSFTITSVTNPAPTLAAISPSTAVAGSPAFTLTVTGASFISSSQVLLNNNFLPTIFVSSTSLTAQIPATDLTATTTASITVQTPVPGGGTSTPLTFTITAPAPAAENTLTILDQSGTDVVWDPRQKQLYVAVPGSANVNPATITVVDPIAGTITASHPLSSAPSFLAISDDSTCLYAVVNGGNTIERLITPSLTSDLQFSLGSDPSDGANYLAGDIKVQPSSSHTLAVSFGKYGSNLVAIFDDTVQRPAMAGQGADTLGNSLQWKPDGTALYAAYTQTNASGFATFVSDDPLFTLPVTSAGIGPVTKYESAFRDEGSRLHIDPITGSVYGDSGEFLDPATGIRLGNLRSSRPNGRYAAPGPLSILDPALHRVFTAREIARPDNTLAFQVQAFDQTDFRLLDTVVLPNAVGTPTNFIRWGNAGLALVTGGNTTNPAGKLYLLDGYFVNPTGLPDTTTGSPLFPVPTLTALSPLTATVGVATPVILTVTGRDFLPQTTLAWNGTTLTTTLVSSTQLSAQIPSSYLAAITQGAITASNTETFASNTLPFAVNPAPPDGTNLAIYPTGGNDLVWNPAAAKLYISMPGIQGEAGDSIAIVDPIAGTVTTTGFLGSDPDRLSLSSDNKLLYVSFLGTNEIEQLNAPTLTKNILWNLGGASVFDGPYFALDLQVEPGSPQTTAVTLAQFDVSPSSSSVTIFDGSIPRPTPLTVAQEDYSTLQWAGANPTLYTVDQSIPESLLTLGVGPSGPAISQVFNAVVTAYTSGLHYDTGTGFLYTDLGQVLRPTDGTTVGTFGASGLVVPDSTFGRAFILGQTSAQANTSGYTLQTFDQTTFALLSSTTVNNVVGKPTKAVRWGANGFAFITRVGLPTDFYGMGPGQLYVLSGSSILAAAALHHPSTALHQDLVHKTWNAVPQSRPRSQAPTRVIRQALPAK